VAATYVQPKQGEMEEALQVPRIFREVPDARSAEIIYEWNVRRGVSIRVCSSIVPGVGGRDVGKDAIRVLVVHSKSDKVFFQATRVHRTMNWATNMGVRVREAWDYIQSLPTCEHCGTPLFQSVSKAGNPYKLCVDKACVLSTPNPFRRGA
jgi:ribosomal protein L24E